MEGLKVLEKLTPNQLARVAAFDASCNDYAGERVVSTPDGEEWPHEEVDFYLRNLFPCQKPPVGEGDDRFLVYSDLYNMCMAERTRQLHRMLVSDRICWKSEGPEANRDLADRIDKLCNSKELSGPAKERCEKYAKSVRADSTPTMWNEFIKWLGGAAFLILLFGGPMHDAYGWAKDRVKAWRSKDPPDGPGASGGGKFRDGVVIDAKFDPKSSADEAGHESRAVEALATTGLLAFFGYAAVEVAAAAKAAGPILVGVARAALSASSALMLFSAPVLEQAADPNRGSRPDA